MPRKLYFSVQTRENTEVMNLCHTVRVHVKGKLILPILRVTVIMLRLMVESVILLKEDDCGYESKGDT